MKYTAEEVRKSADWLYQWERKAGARNARAMLIAFAERIEADEVAADYPECSGDPSSCPENEGHGCCKPNPPAQAAQVDAFADRLRQSIMRDTFQPTADPVAQGEASLVRCKACRRATRAVCDGLDGNGLGCTNVPPIDLDAVRKVIAHLRQFDSPYTRGLADKLEAALQEKGNG